MDVIKDPRALQALTLIWRRQGLSIGFVPTMGFLHEGHLSLIQSARAKADKVVVSVFVNPTQFGPNEDLSTYPRDAARDHALCEGAGVDVLFMPEASAMDAPEAACWVEVPALARHLCAVSRPTHFRGVCTVVSKLFHLAQPHFAFFGEKDWQQLAILRRMVADLMFPVEIVGCPIVREADGLAKSSRNVHLLAAERAEAPHIQKGLSLAAERVGQGERNVAKICVAVQDYFKEHMPSASLDYLEIVDPEKIEPLETLAKAGLIATAVKFSKVRLIDNRLLAFEE